MRGRRVEVLERRPAQNVLPPPPTAHGPRPTAHPCPAGLRVPVPKPKRPRTPLEGMGEMDVALRLEHLKRKFGVEVDTEDVKVPYRETITGKSEAEGRYKKQTGGHGQFAVCTLRVEPLGQGEGFVFADKIVGGAVSKGYIPAVQKGRGEAMAGGGAVGVPGRGREGPGRGGDRRASRPAWRGRGNPLQSASRTHPASVRAGSR